MPPERTACPPSGTQRKVTATAFSGATNGCDCYNGRVHFVAISPIVPIRDAQTTDLATVVDIYNAAIPGRMATADTAPVTVEQRLPWFREFDPARRPLWVFTSDAGGPVLGWLSLRSFYGRPAYRHTVEVGIYIDPDAQRRGIARTLLEHALEQGPRLDIATLLAFVFGHNEASIALFRRARFQSWGTLPRVAVLDGVERDLAILGRRVP